MAQVQRLFVRHEEIAVVGWSCRLPGANSVAELWNLLAEGRCAVTQVPADRFPLQRFGHPRFQERGKSYTWAAGILDDVWGFDPSVFGISPREAEQMDPQQRILLQLTWEALEDAGLPASSLAGSETGVFVGGSQTDYAHAMFADKAIADAHFATGNALAILANRISHIFDLRGPSVTIDTACSSSLVALHQACEALHRGRVDTAIVGGINVIASPVEFISFSQASMLSPTGLCHAFSADADGYVRAEGGIVLVLRKAARAAAALNPVHAVILASDVNSDGRTNGISLPSRAAQQALLRRVYDRAEIDPGRLAFVEAHGTGTPVGDPVEAEALGRSLGLSRTEPLPIGSIKTNIGHTEAASGLAGLMKAALAMQHGVVPRSLHFSAPNPEISFGALNLTVCKQPLALSNEPGLCAGVNSFGFGGTNAHVVIGPAPALPDPVRWRGAGANGFFPLSAATQPALAAIAGNYAERLAGLSDIETAAVASAVAFRRDCLGTRALVSTTRNREVVEALEALVSGSDHPHLTVGTALGDALPVGFVYSGNGSQWAGMGISAYRHNRAFRAQFDAVDECFRQISGWSLTAALFDDELIRRLDATSVAQPLIFAIESAGTAALRALGVQPTAVLGHSVGEVAAAEAAGALDLSDAVKVIYFRSKHQEPVRGLGRMAAVLASAEQVERILAELSGVEIAAVNSSRAVTVAGTEAALAALKKHAASRGIAMLDLGLDYPFHTDAMNAARAPLIADLSGIAPRDTAVAYVSTVVGSTEPGRRLGPDYWWRNIREPVQFLRGIGAMVALGVRCFIEIGPRGMLLRHISDNPAFETERSVLLSLLDRSDQDRDPVARVAAKAFVSGADLVRSEIFGRDPGAAVPLPLYPWQQQNFRYSPTAEAIGIVEAERYAFGGARDTADSLVWRSHIDTALFPMLRDHKVGEQVIFPGTGFLEIAFDVARQWLGVRHLLLSNFEILNPLDLTNGDTREVMTRVSPSSNTFEIFSRPRLSQASWSLHCRGKMQHADAKPSRLRLRADQPRSVAVEALYRLASACGLDYGPAFRLVARVAVHSNDLIDVELAPGASQTDFILDPVRLDACCHGLLTVFAELHAAERGVSYLPVRLDEATLFNPSAVPQRAVIEVLSRSDRAIVADYSFFAPDGEPVALLRGVYCQAVQVRRPALLDTTAFVETLRLADGGIIGESGLAIGADAIADRAKSRTALSGPPGTPHEAGLLVEGCAVAAAYEIASGLADEGLVDCAALVGAGRLAPELQRWIEGVLAGLESAGLAERVVGGWIVIGDPLLPNAASVVRELAGAHPDCAAELMVAGVLAGLAGRARSDAAIVQTAESILSPAVLEFHDVSNRSLRDAGDLVLQVIDDDIVWPRDRAVRVLQLGFGPLSQSLFSLQRRRDAVVTLVEPDRRRCDAARRVVSPQDNIVFVEQQEIEGLGSFDLIVSVDSLHRLPGAGGLSSLKQALAPRGVLIAVEAQPSLFRTMMAGLEPAALSADGIAQPDYGLQRAEDWEAQLRGANFTAVRTRAVRCGFGDSTLIVAEAGGDASAPDEAAPPAASDGRPVVAIVLAAADGFDARLGSELREQLCRRGIDAVITPPTTFLEPPPDNVIHLIGSTHQPSDTAALLTERCLEIKSVVEAIGSAPMTVWHVHRGALAGGAARVDPLATATWAFSRTVANEFPRLNVRRVDVAAHLPPHLVAARLCDVILSATVETELRIDESSVRAVRIDPLRRVLDAVPPPVPSAIRLERRLSSGHRFQWEATERSRPGPDEVEIEVEATGLNFRDLMWTLSLLSDDSIEEGVAGATLGCECAGRVVRIGPRVGHLAVGDRVVAVARSAFATHVTVAGSCAAKLPAHLGFDAGATIPVAFLTAYYSLITQARLRQGEWVLIHGGAGGVGMAAAQIARMRGARIIATAGSTAKRDLLSALGVDHVFDSRSSAFVEEVREVTSTGVDVVLNSLAGEAMERGIGCLQPFGRFVEIGKRDYISNTQIGLRPFKKNLTYFGVDIDQLMFQKSDIGRKLFAVLMKQFESGALTPLPHSVFPAGSVAEAFHLMQHSGHVGKIVVRRPGPELVTLQNKPFVASPSGTHVISGAFGGFGLEAAKWLVERGARHLVLLGRRGATSDEAKLALHHFAAQGVQVYAEPGDIADRSAVERVFETVSRTMPPVVGILHAAMVLEDGLLSNLDEERFHRVLAPKVTGTDNLDRLTRGMPLDYFVLFSSATTLVGNPGQSNYVAANAYMEGIARRRRQEGLKALAIGWGPITDVGVLARSERLRTRFQRETGVRGMRARDALELMARALEQPQRASLAVMTISPTEGIFAADRLPVLASPTYANMVSSRESEAARFTRSVDLHEIARTEGLESVRQALTDIIVVQLARILHAREEDIPRVRPLGEIGVDSLMALEVAMNLEEAAGVHVALTSSIGGLTVGGLANELIAHLDLSPEREEPPQIAKNLAQRHAESVDPDQLAILEEIVGEVRDVRNGGRPLDR